MTTADAADRAATTLVRYAHDLRYDSDISAICAAQHIRDRALRSPDTWAHQHDLTMATLHAKTWGETNAKEREVRLTIRELWAFADEHR